MLEESQAFVVASGVGIKKRLMASPVLVDGTRDRIVGAFVQCAEVLDADGRVQLQREVGDGLAHIAVIVHDLRHRESLQLEIMAVALSAFLLISEFDDRWFRKASTS